MACAFYSRRQLTLIFSGNARDTAWHHLATLGYVTLQHLKVLIVNNGSVIDAKRTGFATAHHATATGFTWAALAAFAAFDGAWETTGYRTQALALVAFQALILARLALRLGLLGGQVALYEERAAL